MINLGFLREIQMNLKLGSSARKQSCDASEDSAGICPSSRGQALGDFSWAHPAAAGVPPHSSKLPSSGLCSLLSDFILLFLLCSVPQLLSCTAVIPSIAKGDITQWGLRHVPRGSGRLVWASADVGGCHNTISYSLQEEETH